LTTPAVSKYFSRNAAFRKPKLLQGIDAQANPPYTIQPLPGRGLGTIANRTLHRGDNIVSYTPVFIIHRKTYSLASPSDRLHFQREAIDLLPARTRELFLALHGHFGGDKIDDIIQTNSFRLDLDDDNEAHTMVLPETSASAWVLD